VAFLSEENMDTGNPAIVIDTVIDGGSKFGKIELKPVTIYKYCLLEKLKSPFITTEGDFTVENIAPTVFVLAKDRSELKEYKNDFDRLKDDAVEWLDDNLDVADLPEIMKATVDMFMKLNKAAPQASGEKK